MTSHSTFHAKQCKLNLKRHTSWHQESSRCSCIASQQTLRPWASSNHWRVQAGGLTKIWPWWSWWSNISNVHLQHFQEFATHDFERLLRAGTESLISSILQVHQEVRICPQSMTTMGCLVLCARLLASAIQPSRNATQISRLTNTWS